jgi:hypothetical protein
MVQAMVDPITLLDRIHHVVLGILDRNFGKGPRTNRCWNYYTGTMFPIAEYQYFGIFENIDWTMGNLIILFDGDRQVVLGILTSGALQQDLVRIATEIIRIRY